MSLPPYSGDLGDAAGADIFTLDQMFGDFGYTCDDLFELAWEETGGGETMPASSGVPCCHLLLPQTTAAPESEMPLPEDEMAAWLSAIVTGDDAVEVAVVTGDPAANSGEEFRERIENKLPTRTEERRVKRRRSKINEKFKMLQQLVPGCDKLSLNAV
uniref:BHLH domain-containing protein n=1 Tax=Leersia perrieri TaxID=77586 RepID=A0A0D9Y151_9ORYZ